MIWILNAGELHLTRVVFQCVDLVRLLQLLLSSSGGNLEKSVSIHPIYLLVMIKKTYAQDVVVLCFLGHFDY